MSKDEKIDTIGEDRPPHPGLTPQPIGLAPKLRDALDALAHFPLCVMGCGRLGLKYTTNVRYTACDEHASKEAKDLDYAPAVRSLYQAIRA